MNSKIRFIEVFFMLLVILSFAATGIMILMGNQDYSIIALAVTSLLVLIEFYLVLTGSSGRVLDLSRTGLRGKQGGKYSGEAYGEDMFMGEYGDPDGFAGEGVGNMRVYQRGEQIDYADSEEN
ncbi:MAG: hypothetical protein HFI34_08050 [Lachnospiraceae bacterium]|nr:hypothetical protein [Lachnospiraceae bacterium]